jgi:hypothetical protein
MKLDRFEFFPDMITSFVKVETLPSAFEAKSINKDRNIESFKRSIQLMSLSFPEVGSPEGNLLSAAV